MSYSDEVKKFMKIPPFHGKAMTNDIILKIDQTNNKIYVAQTLKFRNQVSDDQTFGLHKYDYV